MADIVWSDIVGTSTVDDGGFVGDLLALARAHVDDAVSKNELTSEQAGAVYTEMIPSAFQNAINFGMQEQLMEAQIDTAVAEASNMQARTLAEIIKVYGFDATILDGIITLGTDNSSGKLDYDKELTKEQAEDITDKRKLSLLTTQLSAWASTFNSGKVDVVPTFIEDTSMSTIYDEIKTGEVL